MDIIQIIQSGVLGSFIIYQVWEYFSKKDSLRTKHDLAQGEKNREFDQTQNTILVNNALESNKMIIETFRDGMKDMGNAMNTISRAVEKQTEMQQDTTVRMIERANGISETAKEEHGRIIKMTSDLRIECHSVHNQVVDMKDTIIKNQSKMMDDIKTDLHKTREVLRSYERKEKV